MPPFSIWDIGGCGCEETCSQTFTATGCGSHPVAGLTIRVLDHAGGTVLASGNTDASGEVTLSWAGTGGVYIQTAGATAGRFAAYGATLALTCGGATTIALTPAAGYRCFSTCAIPVPNAWNVTMAGSQTGTGTAVYNSNPAHPNTWSVTFGVGLTAVTVTVDAFGTLLAYQSLTLCVNATGPSSKSCPPAFAASWTWTDFCGITVATTFSVTE